jgi:hypothetical protein
MSHDYCSGTRVLLAGLGKPQLELPSLYGWGGGVRVVRTRVHAVPPRNQNLVTKSLTIMSYLNPIHAFI